MIRCIRSIGLASALLLASQGVAIAGTPLLCFPFNIGAAKTLPIGPGGWKAIDPTYDVSRLVNDTLGLLRADTPVIVRMETIRRATLYAATRPKIGDELLAQLKARTTHDGSALALFDYGYTVATFQQAREMLNLTTASIDGVDGYALVRAALAQRADPAMEFAAAVITQSTARSAEQREHLQRATSAATEGSTLAANLKSHFSGR